jgi:hypothetical protein
MKPKRLVVFVYALALVCPAAARNQVHNPPVPSQQAQKTADDARYPCRAVHTLDFWVGTFDATPWDQPTAPSKGQLHNTREYDGWMRNRRAVDKRQWFRRNEYVVL